MRLHRAAHVDDQMTVEVGLGVVLLDIEPVVASVELPVQVPQVVAGQILPMRGEFDRKPDVRAAVQPVEKALDDRARDQLEVLEVGQEQGIDVFVEQVGRGGPASRTRPVRLSQPTNRATRSPGA